MRRTLNELQLTKEPCKTLSLHAISPEAQAALERQKKKQAISSTIIGFLVIALIMILLSLFFLAPVDEPNASIISYKYAKDDQNDERKVPKPTVDKKPASPSANMSRVITTTAVSDIAVPVPDVPVEMPSVDYGADADFGSGWGGAGGGGSGSASFFNTKTQADRVAYVIDYSASMNGKRDQLMRTELARSVGELKGRIKYQLIFFAGPAWVAGNEIKGSKMDWTIVDKGGKKYRWKSNRGAHGYLPVDDKGRPAEGNDLQTPDWLSLSKGQIEQSMEQIKHTPLVWGTIWEPAIDMALRMKPKPDVIFFMTDGSCGGNVVEIAERIGEKARKAGVQINTVAMMQPQTKDAMLKMAEVSGGSFTLIKEDGKPYDKDGKPIGRKK